MGDGPAQRSSEWHQGQQRQEKSSFRYTLSSIHTHPHSWTHAYRHAHRAGSTGGAGTYSGSGPSPLLSPHVNNQGLLNWPLSSCPWTSHRFARPSPGPLHAPHPRPCLEDPHLLLNPVCAPVVPRSPQHPPSAHHHPASNPPGPLQPSGSIPVTWPTVTAVPLSPVQPPLPLQEPLARRA